MRTKEICRVLNDFLFEGLGSGVFIGVQTHLVGSADSKETLEPSERIGMIPPGGISIKSYLELITQNKYSAVFLDGSVMCIQCTFSNETLTKHRYTYIPYPFDPSTLSGRPDDIPLADWISELVAPEATEHFRSSGTLRFDYSDKPIIDPESPHPFSHMTFGSNDCRVPVRSPLSIVDFLNIVFDNFQRQGRLVWLGFAPHIRCGIQKTSIRENELQFHHLSREDLV
tara:strand:+ start:9731 stop:10411 length:681 start_codon:yes stop_codon:yes gene_type:complete